MKFAIILAVACCGLLVSGCSDQSLMSDEEYAKSRGPAPFSPDPTTHLPPLPDSNPNRTY
jgi:hypothetical protein